MGTMLDSFDAKDSDGNSYIIFVYESIIQLNGKETRPGKKRLVTSEGDSVNHVNENEFLIVSKNIRIYRV